MSEQAPTNVRMEYPDGTAIEPIEIRHLHPLDVYGDGGVREQWVAVFPMDTPRAGARLVHDPLPELTDLTDQAGMG